MYQMQQRNGDRIIGAAAFGPAPVGSNPYARIPQGTASAPVTPTPIAAVPAPPVAPPPVAGAGNPGADWNRWSPATGIAQPVAFGAALASVPGRSEEPTSDLQSL